MVAILARLFSDVGIKSAYFSSKKVRQTDMCWWKSSLKKSVQFVRGKNEFKIDKNDHNLHFSMNSAFQVSDARNKAWHNFCFRWKTSHCWKIVNENGGKKWSLWVIIKLKSIIKNNQKHFLFLASNSTDNTTFCFLWQKTLFLLFKHFEAHDSLVNGYLKEFLIEMDWNF